MSLKLINKNSSSPFHLSRSIVPRGEGAYETGGYNPKSLYNNDAANQAVESLGTTIGAALSSMVKKDKPKKEEVKASPKNDLAEKETPIDLKGQAQSNYSDYSPDKMAPEKMKKYNKEEEAKNFSKKFSFNF